MDVRKASMMFQWYRSTEILDWETAGAVAFGLQLEWKMNSEKSVAVVRGDELTAQIRLYSYRQMQAWAERKRIENLSLFPGAERYVLWYEMYGAITYVMTGRDPGVEYVLGSVMGQVARAERLGKLATSLEGQ